MKKQKFEVGDLVEFNYEELLICGFDKDYDYNLYEMIERNNNQFIITKINLMFLYIRGINNANDHDVFHEDYLNIIINKEYTIKTTLL